MYSTYYIRILMYGLKFKDFREYRYYPWLLNSTNEVGLRVFAVGNKF